MSSELAALSPTSEVAAAEGYRLRAIDGTVITYDDPADRLGWRSHASYDLAAGRFDDLRLTGERKGERLSRFSMVPGDILVGNRGFTRSVGIFDIAERGACFILRRGTKSGRLLDADGRPLDEPAVFALAQDGVRAGGTEPNDVPVQLRPSRHRPDQSKISASDYAKLDPLACRLVNKSLLPRAAEKAADRAARTDTRTIRQDPVYPDKFAERSVQRQNDLPAQLTEICVFREPPRRRKSQWLECRNWLS